MSWHPILNATEGPPGTFTLTDYAGRGYARIEVRRTPDGVRWRTEHPIGTLIGWGASLMQACERAHHAFLRSHGPGGAPPEMFQTPR